MGLVRSSPCETFSLWVVRHTTDTYISRWRVIQVGELDEATCDRGADVVGIIEGL